MLVSNTAGQHSISFVGRVGGISSVSGTLQVSPTTSSTPSTASQAVSVWICRERRRRSHPINLLPLLDLNSQVPVIGPVRLLLHRHRLLPRGGVGAGRTNTNGRNGTPTMMATANLAPIAGSSSAAVAGSAALNPPSSSTIPTRPGPLDPVKASVAHLLTQAYSLPCSTAAQAFAHLVQPVARFRLALDALLPLLDAGTVEDEKNGWESVVQLAELYIILYVCALSDHCQPVHECVAGSICSGAE
ncbi:hypothetical protein JOM56_013314 [Amanita muscaria]